MQSLIRSKSAGVTGGRGTAGAGPGRDLLYRRVPWSVPRPSWPWAVGVVPRHSWLGSTGCGGWGPGCPSPSSWCVCVCAVWPFVLVWVAWGQSCAVWLPCVCVYVLAVCGWWGAPHLGWLLSSVSMVMFKKAEEEVLYTCSGNAWYA